LTEGFENGLANRKNGQVQNKMDASKVNPYGLENTGHNHLVF
jgi:hypothetical protein